MATTQKRVERGQGTTRDKGEVANPCTPKELTTAIPQIRRAAPTREEAIEAVMAEVWRLVEARRVAQNQPCNGDCDEPGETCMHQLKDDPEPAIVVRRAIYVKPAQPGPPPVPARVIRGYRATLAAGNIKSRCECALIV